MFEILCRFVELEHPYSDAEIKLAHWAQKPGDQPVTLPELPGYDQETRDEIHAMHVKTGKLRDEILALYHWWNDVYVPRWNDEVTCHSFDEDMAFEAQTSEMCHRLIDIHGSLWT